MSRGLIDGMTTIAKPLGYGMWLARIYKARYELECSGSRRFKTVFSMLGVGLLPESLSKLHDKYRTSKNALILAIIVSICFGMLGLGALVWLLDITSVAIGVA